jgi:LysM repeat protein
MSQRHAAPARLLAPLAARLAVALAVVAATAGTAAPAWAQAASQLPVTPEWRGTAERVAQTGVPLEDLAPNAPASHTVQPGDTLWGISTLFLKSAWRWPELWGMNLEQIRNPHLIYPGQVLVLLKADGRATLRLASQEADGGLPSNTVKLSPRIRPMLLDNGAIAAIPVQAIGPFLNEAVVFDANELDRAPRIVATQEGRVLVSKGETAYVRGDLGGARDFRLFRELTPLRDPLTRELLGWEGRYVGTTVLVQPEQGTVNDGRTARIVPATFRITSTRLEAGVGDRLSPVPQQELLAYVPRPPARAVDGRIVSVYGEVLKAGQNQIVALNKGARDGIERGHVLALWRTGERADDTTVARKVPLRLPDERHGLLFVFRTFDRVSYALILNVQQPVQAGDRFTQP